jgi:hypothetical protein
VDGATDGVVAVGVEVAATEGVADAATDPEADAPGEGDAALLAAGTSQREATAIRAAPPESNARCWRPLEFVVMS